MHGEQGAKRRRLLGYIGLSVLLCLTVFIVGSALNKESSNSLIPNQLIQGWNGVMGK